MESKFLEGLSQDYLKLLETGEYTDVIIQTGQEPEIKEFRAHSLVLRSRSTYFRDTLSSDWAKAQGNLIIFKQLDISPEVFDIILRFIYGGTICLAEHDARVILELLISTDDLELDDLTDYIQEYLLNNSWRLMSHFVLFHRFAMQNDERFPIIRKCVIELIKENPTTIFDSNDFTTMEQDTLISFFKCHNFSSIKPGILWRNLVEWGVAHTPTVPLQYAEWTDEDFKALGATLEPLIPLIKFTEMDTEEFLCEVRPWKKSLDYIDPEFYTQTLELRQLPFINVTSKFLSLLLEETRDNKSIKEIDSNLITLSDATLIAKWIHEVSINDGFASEEFHAKCDEKSPTVTILRVENTGEILGGYNPINWHSNVLGNYSPTNSSFIFSLGDKVFNYDPILSKVSNTAKAIYQSESYGPCFGGGYSDLRLFGTNFKENCECRCVKTSYEHAIRESEEEFSIDEYEVFQIIPVTTNPKRKKWSILGSSAQRILGTGSGRVLRSVSSKKNSIEIPPLLTYRSAVENTRILLICELETASNQLTIESDATYKHHRYVNDEEVVATRMTGSFQIQFIPISITKGLIHVKFTKLITKTYIGNSLI
ncbi:carbohydrate-binding module family 13 protein [Rhizophagus clarus]|uniref:Carbohydrate-binding module family 13 protein n=1 Tax=Rhizophagus clarus TaxID=94130 RepID=A0A8H3M3M1_9GLOM|nr:carbohydrate-binding module family 13 protein [Rhizophagus clarus]